MQPWLVEAWQCRIRKMRNREHWERLKITCGALSCGLAARIYFPWLASLKDKQLLVSLISVLRECWRDLCTPPPPKSACALSFLPLMLLHYDWCSLCKLAELKCMYKSNQLLIQLASWDCFFYGDILMYLCTVKKISTHILLWHFWVLLPKRYNFFFFFF